MSLDFSPQQKKIIPAGVTTLAGAAILAGALILLVFMVRFFSLFNHVFLPLAVAGVLALVVEPWYNWLRQHARLPVPLALLVLFLSIGLPLIGVLVIFGALIVTQAANLVEEIPRWSQEAVRGRQEN